MTKIPISNAATVIEVHNAYTIQEVEEVRTGAKEQFLQFSRPQDWGNPRWHYEQFKFEWIRSDKHYINHAYCWTDLPEPEQGYPSLFGEIIAVYIMMPGSRAEECGRSHLKEDDFWDEEWGEMPPYFDPDWDDDEERAEFEAEYVNEDDEDE